MLNKNLAAAALAAVLAGGCRRAPDAPAEEGVTLAAPAPSSTVVMSPLASAASSYTNEMQAQNLREQAAELGISRLEKPSATDSEDGSDEPRRQITYQEGLERTREMAREAVEERHALDQDASRSVAVPTSTPGILSAGKTGAPLVAPPQGP